MIGGMKKTVSRLALAAAAVGFSTSAMAADLGGSCCADLEERIAELEATTARKGNRVMSLRISGNVGWNIVYHNGTAAAAGRSEKISVTDEVGEYGSDLTFDGSAKVTSDIEIGFKMDFAVEGRDAISVLTDDLFVYIKSNRLGTVRVGVTDGAADGIHSISLAGNYGQMTDNSHSAVLRNIVGRNDFDGHGADQGFLYISPTLAGFSFWASWLHERNANFNDGDEDERWSVALKYANEFNGVRVAWGIGYTDVDNGDYGPGNTGDFLPDEFITTVSLMHVPTGLFLNGSYGFADHDERTAQAINLRDQETGWTIVGGIERKFIALGATTFWAQYYKGENDGGVTGLDGDSWGLGMAQNIDAAATTMYWAIDSYDQHTAIADNDFVFSSGIRVKF